MSHPDILTPRLRLVCCTAELLQADFGGDRSTFVKLLDVAVPALWPPEHWEPHVRDLLDEQHRCYPHTLGWNRYIVLSGTTPTLIGSLGAFRRTPREAECGYSVLEPWQRRGFATEALSALLARSSGTPHSRP